MLSSMPKLKVLPQPMALSISEPARGAIAELKASDIAHFFLPRMHPVDWYKGMYLLTAAQPTNVEPCAESLRKCGTKWGSNPHRGTRIKARSVGAIPTTLTKAARDGYKCFFYSHSPQVQSGLRQQPSAPCRYCGCTFFCNSERGDTTREGRAAAPGATRAWLCGLSLRIRRRFDSGTLHDSRSVGVNLLSYYESIWGQKRLSRQGENP